MSRVGPGRVGPGGPAPAAGGGGAALALLTLGSVTEDDAQNAGTWTVSGADARVQSLAGVQHSSASQVALWGIVPWDDSWAIGDAADMIVVEAELTIDAGMSDQFTAIGFGIGSALVDAVFAMAFRPTISTWAAACVLRSEGVGSLDGEPQSVQPSYIRGIFTPVQNAASGQIVMQATVQLLSSSKEVLSSYGRSITNLGTAAIDKIYLVHHEANASPVASDATLRLSAAKVRL